jgi:trehalose/maltose hydrolase-like predicted phosphorylase
MDYFELDELEMGLLQEKYDNDISRMDRLFKAEGQTPDKYKLSKQADTLMCFFNIGPDAVTVR